MIRIDWPCDMVVASKKNESRVRQVLHRKGEWGRGRDLPDRRLDEISNVCTQNGMTLYQALSLRRTMMRSFPGGMKRVNHSSSMGSSEGQQQVSALLEESIEKFLIDVCKSKNENPRDVFRTEKQLLSEMKAGTRTRGPTPDILFLKSVSINGVLVKWIDAKMYYGSATYGDPNKHPKLPNGKLRQMADRYNSYYSCPQGAFVFGRGFCHDLRHIVTNAILLDATPLDTSAVEDYQNDSQEPNKYFT